MHHCTYFLKLYLATKRALRASADKVLHIRGLVLTQATCPSVLVSHQKKIIFRNPTDGFLRGFSLVPLMNRGTAVRIVFYREFFADPVG